MRSSATASKGAPPAQLGAALEFLRRLWAVDHGLAQVSKAMDQALGVTGPQRLAVRIVGRMPGIGPADLAELLHVGRAGATGLVKRLEQRGLVRRAQDAADGRRWHLFLTPAGRRVDRVDRGTIEERVTLVLRASNRPEVAAAIRVLDRLVLALAVSAGQPSAGRRRRG